MTAEYRSAAWELFVLVLVGYAAFFAVVGLALSVGYLMGVTLT